MKLSQCTYGKLVCNKLDNGEVEFVGMIVGIGEILGSPAPLVQWQYSIEPAAYLHECLEPYED